MSTATVKDIGVISARIVGVLLLFTTAFSWGRVLFTPGATVLVTALTLSFISGVVLMGAYIIGEYL